MTEHEKKVCANFGQTSTEGFKKISVFIASNVNPVPRAE